MQTHLVLQKYVDRKKKSTKGFSLRGLATKLDLSVSFLSRVLAGKKPIPYPLLLKLIEALDIEPEVFASLKEAHQQGASMKQSPRRGKAEVQTAFEEWELAPKDANRILRSWFYLAILDLTSLPDFDGSAKMVARRLGLSLTAAEVALRDLESLGMIETQNGRVKKKVQKIRFSAGTSLEDIRRFHGMMLEKAHQELKTATSDADYKRRLITGITLTASAEKIEQAKKKLAECLHEIANDLIQDQGTDVYHLSAQLFPLTKPK